MTNKMNAIQNWKKLGSIFGLPARKSGEETGFGLVASLLLLIFLTGGSGRADILSLALLRPIAVLAAAYGMWTMQPHQWREARWLFGSIGACFILAALHLIPMPPAAWQALPGREIVADVDKIVGISGQWRPLSMAPEATWNALYALFVPLAVLSNGVQLSRDGHERLLTLFLGLGFASGFLAILQLLGSPHGPLYFYRVTNFGEGVGFFANRNHQAVFLSSLFPMLAIFAAGKGRSRTRDRRRLIAASLGAVLLLSLILISGSRTGLVASAVGLAAAPVLYWLSIRGRRGQPGLNRNFAMGVTCLAAIIALLITWAIFSGRALSIQRAVGESGGQELRAEYWPVILDALPGFMPFGSGIGSYERVYQVIEPASQLRSVYSNHAHNDLLELALTAGIPGLVLLAAILLLLLRSAALIVQATRDRKPLANWGWLGLSIILIAGSTSLTDYPLRIPFLSAWLVIACLWIRLGATATSTSGSTG